MNLFDFQDKDNGTFKILYEIIVIINRAQILSYNHNV